MCLDKDRFFGGRAGGDSPTPPIKALSILETESSFEAYEDLFLSEQDDIARNYFFSFLGFDLSIDEDPAFCNDMLRLSAA